MRLEAIEQPDSSGESALHQVMQSESIDAFLITPRI